MSHNNENMLLELARQPVRSTKENEGLGENEAEALFDHLLTSTPLDENEAFIFVRHLMSAAFGKDKTIQLLKVLLNDARANIYVIEESSYAHDIPQGAARLSKDQKEAPAAYLVCANPIADGGMGKIQLAFDMRLLRRVALKTAKDEEKARILQREAQIHATVETPGVVRVYDFLMQKYPEHPLTQQREIAPTLVMQYMDPAEHTTFNKVLEKQQYEGAKFNPEQIQHFLEQIAIPLSKLHQTHIHLDLKPENIFYGKDETVAVTDFGVAEPQGTQTQLVGTFPYLAPEHFMGTNVDQRADIFSLGVILYTMVTGHGIYEQGHNMFSYVRQAERLMSDMSDISNSPELQAYCQQFQLQHDKVVQFFEKILAGKVDHRFRSVNDVVKAFRILFQ